MPNPTFEKEKQPESIKLDFFTALKKVLNGQIITRLDWGDASLYGFLRANILHIHNESGDHQWIVAKEDMEATDWVAFDKE